MKERNTYFEVSGETLAKCEECNAIIATDLDAWKTSIEDAGLEDKPLGGQPVAVKDNINVKGFPMTGATPALKDFRPAEDAPAIKRVKEAGGVIVAKTNLHELAFGITCNNPATGPVKNPFNHELIAGGSSGGSAVAVALDLVPYGIGTDTGGSCRIPAALCGICGMRPTSGLIGAKGAIPLSSSRDTIGPFAKNVHDLALLYGALAGESADKLESPEPAMLRLGVPRGYFYDDLDESLAKVIEAALERIAKAGVTLVEVDILGIGELTQAMSFPMVFYETAHNMPGFFEEYGCGVDMQTVIDNVKSPDVKGVLELLTGDGATPEEAYRDIMDNKRPALQKLYADYFSDNNVAAMICPTIPLPARPLGQDETVELNGNQVPTFPTFIRNCDPGSCAGVPSISIPAGKTDDGLHVGIMVEGPLGFDRKLLGSAATVEKLLEN